MPADSNFVWINKSSISSSLSNCRNEKETFRRIRSRALAAGHHSSRVRRPIKRKPLHLAWIPKNLTKASEEEVLRPADQEPKKQDLIQCIDSRHEDLLGFKQQGSSSDGSNDCANLLIVHRLSGIPDPFSCHPIELDSESLEYIWYFENIWTQCAFKLLGCAGYGQLIERCEITSIIRQSLSNRTRCYCLLAAISARIGYIHCQQARNDHSKFAHVYAVKALSGLRQRVQNHILFSEDDSMDVLFLAAYEIFCENETGAAKHLMALRELFGNEISNTFLRRLRANLELLVGSSMNGERHRAINILVQSR